MDHDVDNHKHKININIYDDSDYNIDNGEGANPIAHWAT